MDIFEMANEATVIAEKEQYEAEQETQKEKARKVNIMEVLQAIAEKDYSYYKNEIVDKGLEKAFAPFIMNLWMSKITGKGLSKSSRKDQSVLDSDYSTLIYNTNDRLNKNLFTFSKSLAFLKGCTITPEPLSELLGPYGRRGYNLDFVKEEKKTSKIKVTPELMTYLQQELLTSKDKITDMINNGLITSDNIKSLQSDLNTLTDQPKKRNSTRKK